MGFSWFILGNGRKGYLQRTIASWEANLLSGPDQSFIFDDSGDSEYLSWLEENYSNRFTIVPTGGVGQANALRIIFDNLKATDAEYFLGIEEDWMLFRGLDIDSIIKALESNQHILQMRIPRTIWHADYHRLDIDAGSLLAHHLEDSKNQICKQLDEWYEIRSGFYFWSHNPSVFHRGILDNEYPNTRSHEYDFGIQLLSKFKKATVGFWAKNKYDAYITHIGFRDQQLLDSLPEHNG